MPQGSGLPDRSRASRDSAAPHRQSATASRLLPQVADLATAVRNVIESNKQDGYRPTRFIHVTQAGSAEGLQVICELLIIKGEVLEYLETALLQHPTLLTLEDLVAVFGSTWGISAPVIDAAKARSEYFDRLVGFRRDA